ncbi:AUGMIN subunit 8-like [Bidens hawaiensis]|uniref:AUGMIN subunit 8-like n=1 Tax=Bidens hawaiensis TaxID=980011 RepID=UPI004049EC1C
MWSNSNQKIEKNVGSRYRSPTPRRCASPNTSRTFTKTPLSTRALSTERRRPVTPQSPSSSSSSSNPSTPVHDTSVNVDLAARKAAVGGKLPETLWPSRTRSLSVSFMSNAFSLSTSKREKPPPQALTDGTLKPSSNVSVSQKRVSTPERKRSPLKGKNAIVQTENRWPGKTSSKGLTKGVDFPDKSMKNLTLPNINVRTHLEKSASDNLHRMSNNISSSLSSRSQSLPANGSARLPSPCKKPGLGSKSRPISPAPSKRASASPSHIRPSSPLRQPCSSNRVSVLTFVADIKKGKKVNDQIEDAHYLRLLYNRQLQWRYINANAEAAFKYQKSTAQTSLYNVCRSTSELHASVAAKKIELNQLRLKLKLSSCLNQQTGYLNEWAKIENDHNLALSGAIEDLKSSTLRLPVTGGATVDNQTMKSSLRSALEVMQTMESTMQSTISRLEESNCLAYELANVVAHERALINECEALLNSAASLQENEYSLRTHLVQMKQELTTH